MKIKPLGNKVVLKEIEKEERTKSGILLPSGAKEKPFIAEVIEVGPGEMEEGGTIRKPNVNKGDKVLYSQYSSTEIKLDDEEYLIVNSDDILAILL